MVTISQIIHVLSPVNTRIVNKDIQISQPIQLDTQNTRDDVLMWVSPQNISLLPQIYSGTIICPLVDKDILQAGCNYIFSEQPRSTFSAILKAFFAPKQEYCISKTAIIDPSVLMGQNVFIGEHVVIEKDCVIGDNCVIGHNTVIHFDTIIQNNVKIGCNNVVGGIGFGYEKDETGTYMFLPHLGNVILEDFVEIGNCTTIDRAVMGSTTLRKNVKVDNLVHIAHGVDIGENSLIIANAMIGGSTKIGKNVWIAPSSSLINKIEIGDNTVVGMGAVVLKTSAADSVMIGNPARPLERKKN